MSTLVRSAVLHGYESLARSLGADPDHLLMRSSLSPQMLTDPNTLISAFSGMCLMELTAVETNCPTFGLKLSLQQDLSVLGPVGLLVRHASTMAEALDLVSRYIYIHTPTANIEVKPVADDSKFVDVNFSLKMSFVPPCTQTIDLVMGLVVQGFMWLGRGGQYVPAQIRLPHPRLAPLSEYEAVFGCPCHFDAPVAAMRFNASYLHMPLSGYDSTLKSLAKSYIDQNFGGPQQFFVDRVRSTIRQLLGNQPVTQVSVASALALHSRTMQRRLEAEGHQFKSVVDTILRERLIELIGAAQPMSLSQIAMALGYTEQAALTRSCRRWFNCTPTDLRHTLSVGGSSGDLKLNH